MALEGSGHSNPKCSPQIHMLKSQLPGLVMLGSNSFPWTSSTLLGWTSTLSKRPMGGHSPFCPWEEADKWCICQWENALHRKQNCRTYTLSYPSPRTARASFLLWLWCDIGLQYLKWVQIIGFFPIPSLWLLRSLFLNWATFTTCWSDYFLFLISNIILFLLWFKGTWGFCTIE